jgi:RimJ/RimL family protein N-acetyltransferase
LLRPAASRRAAKAMRGVGASPPSRELTSRRGPLRRCMGMSSSPASRQRKSARHMLDSESRRPSLSPEGRGCVAAESGAIAPLACEAGPPQVPAGFTIRTVRANDRAALCDLFDRLSPQSRHNRFLGPKSTLSAHDLETLTDLDHVEREALALVAPDGRFTAVARYGVVAGDADAAEVALVVADEWQGRGIGTGLASLLMAEVRRHRIGRLQATTLADNLPARKLLRHLGFTVTSIDGGLISFELHLAGGSHEAGPNPRTVRSVGRAGMTA